MKAESFTFVIPHASIIIAVIVVIILVGAAFILFSRKDD